MSLKRVRSDLADPQIRFPVQAVYFACLHTDFEEFIFYSIAGYKYMASENAKISETFPFCCHLYLWTHMTVMATLSKQLPCP